MCEVHESSHLEMNMAEVKTCMFNVISVKTSFMYNVKLGLKITTRDCFLEAFRVSVISEYLSGHTHH